MTEHAVRVEKAGQRWRWVCSCRAKGEPVAQKKRALDEGDRHRRQPQERAA